MKIKFGYHSGRVASECDQLKWSTKIDLWMCLLRHSKTVLGRNHSLASLYILYFHLCHLKNGWQTRPERRVRRQQSARPRSCSWRPRIAPRGTPPICDRKTPCTRPPPCCPCYPDPLRTCTPAQKKSTPFDPHLLRFYYPSMTLFSLHFFINGRTVTVLLYQWPSSQLFLWALKLIALPDSS